MTINDGIRREAHFSMPSFTPALIIKTVTVINITTKMELRKTASVVSHLAALSIPNIRATGSKKNAIIQPLTIA